MSTLAEVWTRLPRWARASLTFLDLFINASQGGQVGDTLSERFAKSQARGERVGIIACTILDRYDPGHCARALKYGHG